MKKRNLTNKNKHIYDLRLKEFIYKIINSMKNISEQINKIENKLDKSDDDKNKNQIKNGNLSKKLMDETIEPIESWTLHGLPNAFRAKYLPFKIINSFFTIFKCQIKDQLKKTNN